MHTAEKKHVIKAIGDLGRRVTPADVATKTGLPILVVQQELNKVASENGGHLQVGTTGDIVYSFNPGFSSAYLSRGFKAFLLLAGANIFAALFYIVRISFGVALIASLVIGIIFIIAVALAMMFGLKGDRDDRDGGFGGFDWNFGSGFHFSFWDYMILRDILWWNSSPRNYRPTYDYSKPTVRKRSKSNFLLNCFSFLFGDGDPNEGLDEKRWQLIAQVIKRNDNVVTAEQLSPYTGADPKDEDAVLPTLVRFNGRPEVTSKGNIVYVFESMQTIAADQTVDPPAYLQEFPVKFSTVDDGELLPVYIVAGLNLAVVYTCYKLLAIIGSPPIAVPIIWVMIGYAIAFISVPIFRAIFNAFRNAKIDARNVQRFRYGQIVQHPSEEIANKLLEARDYRIGAKKISERDIVFTTENDSRDQDDELTDQFKEMEEKGKKKKPAAAAPKQDIDDEGRVINVSPEAEDEGTVINIKKHAEEFDASP